jgi:hypothetical protein
MPSESTISDNTRTRWERRRPWLVGGEDPGSNPENAFRFLMSVIFSSAWWLPG